MVAAFERFEHNHRRVHDSSLELCHSYLGNLKLERCIIAAMITRLREDRKT
jgi:hypothetical protein